MNAAHLLATGTCLICGATITRIEAPLHIEDHAQAGEMPESPGTA